MKNKRIDNESKVKRNILSIEDIKQLQRFAMEVKAKMMNNPEEGYEFFLSGWETFDQKRKKIIQNEFNNEVETLNYTLGEIYPFRDAVYKAIIAHMKEDFSETELLVHLKIGEGHTLKKIVKVFKRMQTIGAIRATNKELALAISGLFKEPYDTIIQYLEKSDSLIKTPDILNESDYS